MGSDLHDNKVTNAAPQTGAKSPLSALRLLPRRAAHILIRAYQLSLSSIFGRHCRYLPSCSAYADEAIARYGMWAGSFMGVARLCRCHPWGKQGFDPVPDRLPEGSSWIRPWRYGDWRGPRHCEPVQSSNSKAQA
jgi:uncharacterized protein